MRVSRKEVVAGAVTPIVVVTATLSYVALIFSGDLIDFMPMALGFGLVSAALMAIIFALWSRVPYVIAGPDSKPTTVLAIMAAFIATTMADDVPSEELGLIVLAALVVGTLATGAILFLLGQFRLGKWIRYVPYPVVGGFMAAAGWLLALGGLGLLAGETITWSSLQAIGDLHLPQIVAGLAVGIALWLAQRSGHPLALPAMLVGSIVLVHIVIAASGTSLEEAADTHWLLDVGGGSEWVNPVRLIEEAARIDFTVFLQGSGEFVGLVAVTVMTLLLSLVAIEVDGKLDVDVDYELRLNGAANMAVGLAGGMVGTVSVSRTLINRRIGATGRAAGLITGAICLLVLLVGTNALELVPIPVVGGLLFFIGTDMLHEWLIRNRRTMPLTDYFQVAAIMFAIVAWDFVAGVVVGIVAACVTFAVNTSRVRPVRQGLDRSAYRSRVDRPLMHEEALLKHGEGIQIMWLHGFMFFGSAHRLLLDVRELIGKTGEDKLQSLILDFRQVLGIDSSAVLSFGKLKNLAERESFRIALSSVPPGVEKALRASGFVGDDVALTRVFPDLDSALEWCEDITIAEHVSTDEQIRSADEWLAGEIGEPSAFAHLLTYLDPVEFDEGAVIFDQGAEPDALYLLYTGRVTILFRATDGSELRLRSMVGPTVLGEIGLYRTVPRGASVRVDQKCVAYRLSAEGLREMERDDPRVACEFHRFMVRVVATRLDFANREIAGLQS